MILPGETEAALRGRNHAGEVVRWAHRDDEPTAAASRPVIDQSGLTDRYDFTLNWRPDEFQFPRASAPQRAYGVTNGADSPPDLFTAFQEQLGMKLEATKARADVLVIDKVSKPSEN